MPVGLRRAVVRAARRPRQPRSPAATAARAPGAGRAMARQPTRSPPRSSSTASASASSRARSGFRRAVLVARKRHRPRRIDPDRHRLRRLPFAFAHEMRIRPGRPPPVDRRARIAGMRRAVLPELIARARPPAAMLAQHHGRRQMLGLGQQGRQGLRPAPRPGRADRQALTRHAAASSPQDAGRVHARSIDRRPASRPAPGRQRTAPSGAPAPAAPAPPHRRPTAPAARPAAPAPAPSASAPAPRAAPAPRTARPPDRGPSASPGRQARTRSRIASTTCSPTGIRRITACAAISSSAVNT